MAEKKEVVRGKYEVNGDCCCVKGMRERTNVRGNGEEGSNKEGEGKES